MLSNVVNLRKYVKQRWIDRRQQQKKAPIKKYISIDKMSVLCKCPKCEIEHRLLIRWCGRGTPRVFCASCRAMVASIGDASIEPIHSYAAKSSQKMINYGYE